MHTYVPKYIPTIRTFEEFIKSKPVWIFKPIKNYRIHHTESLLFLLTTQDPFIISTDGSKTAFKCDISWKIATKNWNPSCFRVPTNIRTTDRYKLISNRMYASLTSLLFKRCYAEFFSIEILNTIDAIYDNKN